MSTCKVAKILAFTSTTIPTNTYIHGRLIVAINGYTRWYEKVTWSQKRLHLALQPFMQPVFLNEC